MIPLPPRSTLFPYTTLFRSTEHTASQAQLKRLLNHRGHREHGEEQMVWLAWRDGPSCQRTKRSEEHTSELQSHSDLVCRLLLEKKKKKQCVTTSTPNDLAHG